MAPRLRPREEENGPGLSTVYGIIRKHKGTISASSQPGEGTSIRIELSRHS